MKTENTPENKAKFFAQYWGQNVQYYTTNGIDYPFQVNENFTEALGISYLLLTPLKNISNEDAIEVAKINIGRLLPEMDERQLLQVAHRQLNGISNNKYDGQFPIEFINMIDFLRSKSYLLPYKDLSTDDLIAYGWAKEKES